MFHRMGFALCVLGASSLLAGSGCQVHTSGPTETPAAGRRAGLRIPDEVLRKNGLEGIWYNTPDAMDTPVRQATLLPDGLFLATSPSEKKEGRLKLINRTNGHTEWNCLIEEALRTAPSVYRYPPGPQPRPNEVYFSQLDTVHCYDLQYGDLLWKQALPFPISTRVVADDKNIFVGSDNGRVFGVKKKTAVDEWTYRTGGTVKGSPVVEGSAVFATSSDGSIYRFAAATGWIKGVSWKVDTGSRIEGDPVVFSRWVLAGSMDYKLYCLEMQDGGIFWTFQAEAPIEDTPVVYSFGSNQDFAYCIGVNRSRRGDERTLFSVKLTTGQETWRRKGILKVVSIGKKNLYLLEDGPIRERSIIAVDVLSGEERFRIPAGGFAFVPTNIADHGRNLKERGRIYLVASDGTVQVIGERL